MDYVFRTPIPLPWLLADILTVSLSMLLVVFIARRSRHPAMVFLECFGFVFLYAGLFENFAVVNGWYAYGRSLLMFGDVPLSVPLLEMDVFITGLWILEKMNMPGWTKPVVLGLFGMLQDLSLDPLAVRQVFTVGAETTGRWTWLLEPWMANIYSIPVYNFPGWMLIMLYASIYTLLGRHWFGKSGCSLRVGFAYPILAMLAAMLTMVSPLSQFLLWMAPFFAKGGNIEWVMFAAHLIVPSAFLVFAWRGRMRSAFSLRTDWPLFAIPAGFHVADLAGIMLGGFHEVLWLAVLASAIHWLLLGVIYWRGLASGKPASQEYRYQP